MMLKLLPIEGHRGLYRTPDTGQVLNERDFKPWSVLHEISKSGSNIFPCQARYILRRWSILLHPWPELISPSLVVSLCFAERYYIEKMPLLIIAEPMRRSEDDDLVRRIEALEEALKIKPKQSPHDMDDLFVQNRIEGSVRIEGPSDALGHLMERLKYCRLQLNGLESRPYTPR